MWQGHWDLPVPWACPPPSSASRSVLLAWFGSLFFHRPSASFTSSSTLAHTHTQSQTIHNKQSLKHTRSGRAVLGAGCGRGQYVCAGARSAATGWCASFLLVIFKGFPLSPVLYLTFSPFVPVPAPCRASTHAEGPQCLSVRWCRCPSVWHELCPLQVC